MCDIIGMILHMLGIGITMFDKIVTFLLSSFEVTVKFQRRRSLPTHIHNTY
jgi:hypothetical protein